MWRRLKAVLRQRLLNSDFARLIQGDGPKPGPVTLFQRQVFILPTRAGLFFAAVLFIMLLAAINYSNSLGYLLTFTLGGVFVLVIVHTYRNLYRLHVNLGAIEPVFAHTDLHIPLQISNTSPIDRLAVAAGFAREHQRVVDIPAHGEVELRLASKSRSRGWHPVGRFTLETRFPLGLFRAWSYVELERGLLVYPQPSPRRLSPPQSQYRAKQTGDQGFGSDDFAGLRSYRGGDPLKHIHWKAYARNQNLLVKQFGGDRSDEIILDWRAVPGEDTEARLSQLTRWVLDAEREHLEYGLWLPGKEIPPSRGAVHKHLCLKALALFGQTDTVNA